MIRSLWRGLLALVEMAAEAARMQADMVMMRWAKTKRLEQPFRASVSHAAGASQYNDSAVTSRSQLP